MPRNLRLHLHPGRAGLLVPVARLLERVGAIPDVAEYFRQSFLIEYFPKGEGFPALSAAPAPDDLPVGFNVDARFTKAE